MAQGFAACRPLLCAAWPPLAAARMSPPACSGWPRVGGVLGCIGSSSPWACRRSLWQQHSALGSSRALGGGLLGNRFFRGDPGPATGWRACRVTAAAGREAAEAESNEEAPTPPPVGSGPFEYSQRFVKEEYRKPVGLWLLGCCGWVAGLVLWGGLTRLTESGLSMTRWKFSGSKWPCSEEEWLEEFAAYQARKHTSQTPEYLQLNLGMSLSDYKRIYFFEWTHRWLGRAAGILFFLGAAACALKRCVKKPLAVRLAVYGLLGGFQGLVGWWMVRSGLKEPETEVKTPRVSPYRLAFHLVTATCLYTLLLWQSLALLLPSPSRAAAATAAAATAAAAKQAHAFAALSGVTFVSGAFVAGNDAGRCCNTWPKMLNNWVPPEVYVQPITWRRFFENPPTVQFDHRCLAYLTLLSSFLIHFANKNKPLPPPVKAALRFLPFIASLQVLLGITTLLLYVPTELGVLHQVTFTPSTAGLCCRPQLLLLLLQATTTRKA
ncbi:hypothetical protein Efla_001845 [Eimeria flavescens]